LALLYLEEIFVVILCIPILVGANNFISVGFLILTNSVSTLIWFIQEMK